MVRNPLSRQEVINAIERKGSASPIPLCMHKWWGGGLEQKLGQPLAEMAARFPEDIYMAWYEEPGRTVSPNANPAYRFGYKDSYADGERHSIGESTVLLPEWSELDLFLDDFPDPDEPGNFACVERSLASAQGRYKLGAWWTVFHERFWAIRGMENLMMDYYDNMDGLKVIGHRVLEFYKRIVDRYAALGFDGIFTSDDLGHQTGPMMAPEIFKELYLPLYEEFIGYVHSKGMHVWLHSCGDNSLLMDYLISAGLDVFHPVQKGCMDYAETVSKYGNRISFLAGVDVQHLLPEGSVEEVRGGVRELMDTFYKPEGGLLLAMGNGIMPGTPLENIEAALTEMALYQPRA